MIRAISNLDREQAAGLLARVALTLEYDNIASEPANETSLRNAVIKEARIQLGLSADDDSLEALQKIGDLLDAEADRLTGDVDDKDALLRLAERGDLPSDLYEIQIVPNLEKLYGRDFSLEEEIIRATVKAPSSEQHFGANRRAHEPALISLFVKQFRTRFYLKDFYMLVAGQREGLILNVHQAWRLYPSRIRLPGAKDPVQWLQSFADQYAADVIVNGKTGHYFFYEENVTPSKVIFPQDKEIYFSRFAQNNLETGQEQASLIVSIDIQKYKKTLSDMRVDRKDMMLAYYESPTPNN